MSDYIKREDALKAVNGIHEDDLPRNNKIEVCDVLTLVVPSADVAPVRHGMWVDVDRMQMHDLHGVLTWGNSFKCTECNFKTFAVEGHMSQYHYCPNCGARMDGDEDE
ncbi:MAG: hypothetical protein J6N19_02115 [Clostridium sp.]|nr:hypothetical protein [Clostridium sp.]